jgi:hypothetical protein
MGATSGAGSADPYGAPEYTHVIGGVRVARSVAVCVTFSKSFFLSFFFWPLCRLSFFY